VAWPAFQALWAPAHKAARRSTGRFWSSLTLFFQPAETHAGLLGAVVGTLFLFVVADGPTHATWLLHPATARTQGVVLFAKDGDAQLLHWTQREFDYTYEVDGHFYDGQCYAYWTDFKLDAPATVAYDPAAPQRSYLEGTTPTWSPALLAWGMLAIFALVAVSYAGVLFVSFCRVIRGH
jgi:hypothetical protein